MRPSRHLVPPYLLAFLCAAELGSIAAAAEKLHLTHSAISKRVRALERTLGVQLFVRGGARLDATPAGRRLYTYASQVVALERAMQSDMAQARDSAPAGNQAFGLDATPLARPATLYAAIGAPRAHVAAAPSVPMQPLAALAD
ncbi:MAG TPA: LysR family transcriptional regulator [Xanthomonadales bacterium]|nr:LysR family transcriptional regulator [Xanthomonadales bacterium]